MLSDKRIDDTEGLTRSRRTQYNGGTEGVDDIDPSFVHPLVEVIYHGDVHRIFILILLFRLLKRLILKVKPVFSKFVVVVPCNTIQPLMHQHRPDDGRQCVQYPVRREPGNDSSPCTMMYNQTHDNHGKARNDRVKHHSLQVEFQAFLCFRAYTGYPNTDQFYHLTRQNAVKYPEPCNQLQDKSRNLAVCHDRQIHH